MKRVWPWVNLGAFLVVVIVNALANILPLNGITTGEISDRFPVYFVPAGYVFSIWGLIYLLLAVYVTYGATRRGREVADVGCLFALSCVANVAWIFLWHYGVFGGTILAMVVLLGSLVAIYLRLRVRYPPAARSRWLVQLPFSVYLGWVSVATVANVSDVLYFWGWNGGGIAPEVWAALMMVVAFLLALAMAYTRGDWAYGAVIVWALAGIGMRQIGTALVAPAAWVLATLTAVGVIALALMQPRKKRGAA